MVSPLINTVTGPPTHIPPAHKPIHYPHHHRPARSHADRTLTLELTAPEPKKKGGGGSSGGGIVDANVNPTHEMLLLRFLQPRTKLAIYFPALA